MHEYFMHHVGGTAICASTFSFRNLAPSTIIINSNLNDLNYLFV